MSNPVWNPDRWCHLGPPVPTTTPAHREPQPWQALEERMGPDLYQSWQRLYVAYGNPARVNPMDDGLLAANLVLEGMATWEQLIAAATSQAEATDDPRFLPTMTKWLAERRYQVPTAQKWPRPSQARGQSDADVQHGWIATMSVFEDQSPTHIPHEHNPWARMVREPQTTRSSAAHLKEKAMARMYQDPEDPEGMLILDDENDIKLSEMNAHYASGLGAYRKDQAPAQRAILTCELCGFTNEEHAWRVHHDVNENLTICAKCTDKRREAQRVERLAKEEKQLLANGGEQWIASKLKACGMRPLEIGASLAKVPSLIRNALKEQVPEALKAMMSGYHPNKGFGLVGTSRIGKTLADTALVRQMFKAYLEREAPVIGFEVDVKQFMFVSWPSLCAKWRLDWDGKDSRLRVKMVKQLSTKRLVLIDDLGREGRASGRTYLDDPCTLLLNEIISERHAHNRPMLWTSNLSPDGLMDYYGAALYGRLEELAAPIEIVDAIPFVRGHHPEVG